jgi:membrane protein DedA with SNARE-associated domain
MMPALEQDDEPEADPPSAPRPRPRRRVLPLLITPLVLLVIASYIGDLLTTTWADRHPLALILLNSRNRILILATNQLDPFSYYAGATFRLLLSDPLFFVLGRLYGDAGVQWVERKSPTYGRLLRRIESAFGIAAYPLVFAAPNNVICLFAGASGMPIPAFAAVNVAGTLVRLYLIRWLGDAFQAPIDDILDFFARYRLQLFLLSFVLVALSIWNDQRKGTSDLGSVRELEELEETLEEELDEGASE